MSPKFQVTLFASAILFVLPERDIVSKVSSSARRTADTATDTVQRANVEDVVVLLTEALEAELTGEHLQEDRTSPW